MRNNVDGEVHVPGVEPHLDTNPNWATFSWAVRAFNFVHLLRVTI